ncbi:MAG: hypothetical protein LCH84_09200 [Gemmatimonadetes bacterium]|nr:hypothetical protein [Gemmatimonadota bacterium]
MPVLAWALGGALLAACAGGRIAPAPPSPAAPVVTDSAVPRPAVRALMLPATTGSLTWRVTNSAVLRVSASGAPASGAQPAEQRTSTQALVNWTATRTPTGGLRATGQVDSFVVRSTLDTGRARAGSAPSAAARDAAPTLVLLDATLDSAFARVVTRPPLTNECDRVEAAAAQLARELLLRIPDGMVVGAQWRDSSVALVCRSGVPMAVHTTTLSTLEGFDDEVATLVRTTQQRVDGKGGSPFQALEVSGSGSGTQRVRLRVRDGAIETLDDTSTLTLLLTDRVPAAAARTQQVVQQRTLHAERVRR